jgi:hypothetical protein
MCYSNTIQLLFFRSNTNYELRSIIERNFNSIVQCSNINEFEDFEFKLINYEDLKKDNFALQLINILSDNTLSEDDNIFHSIKALMFSLEYLHNSNIIDAGLEIILKNLKKKLSDETFLNYISFLEVQFPRSNVFECFKNIH